ncbi:uncharacterized protein MELLADRAFT_60669 [Melampsora larici-populina 98AG31]|uniref:Uncharacterized protein n=1 Tax=Melampsora larici-populina (strain 98AG31 / pathotype 3-4-7) TaxID=747676 RepID=F4RBW9_MELLP|nr:uncharacterized protein MELLADRAFT_60669 [Melampsora larici-populina 98AG31]EGG10178.1 hypothetical protein MELLADRAFT_60669 [Melampsora larici-populina 98AG31]
MTIPLKEQLLISNTGCLRFVYTGTAKKPKKQKRTKTKKQLKGKDKAKKSKSKKDKKRKKKSSKKSKSVTEIDIGSVPTGDLMTLQPFWGDQMSDLHTSIPLTVFDQNFARADKDEHNRNHNSTSSKNKTNKGLNAPSEYRLTFGEWSECMSLFRQYLSKYYGQKPLAKRLQLHIENVKSIKRSTECWMTALRYDILVREQVFVKRDGKTRMKDIGTRMTQYKNQAKDKSLRLGEANCRDTNPYAGGGQFESRHPETGAFMENHHMILKLSCTLPVVIINLSNHLASEAIAGLTRKANPSNAKEVNAEDITHLINQWDLDQQTVSNPNMRLTTHSLQTLPCIKINFPSQQQHQWRTTVSLTEEVEVDGEEVEVDIITSEMRVQLISQSTKHNQ